LPKSVGGFFGDMVLLNRKFRWLAVTGLLSLWWNLIVFAQEGDKPSAIETTPPIKATTFPAAESKVEEIRPSVFYLPDKDGNLQAVLDFRYEDFIELYKIKQRLEEHEELPRYSLQNMSINGSAGREYADLTIQFQVLVRDSDWVRVPLRLDQALLSEPAQYQGPGEHFIHFEGSGRGYVSWIRSPKEGQHNISLKVLVPLNLVGEQTKLVLFTPRATRSELKLTVPQAKAVGTVSEGATLLPPEARQDDGTVFTVLGFWGDFEMSWHKAGDRLSDIPAVLEATGNILARMDNRGITSEATVSVHSYSSQFDRFVVRLPPGAELVPYNTPGYSLLPMEGKKEADGRQELVEVRLHKKTAGPVDVRLSARRNFEREQASDAYELAGFEVMGAVRQWGTIAVAADNNWQVVFGLHEGLRQIDELPESIRGEGVVAAFEYSALPYTLTARLAPRKTRINVDPEYLLFVDPDRVQLEAKLAYFIRGAKVNVLHLAMADWELDEIGPENLVSVEGVEGKEDGLLSIPLKQASSGQVELRLRAHKMLGKSANAFAVSLPLPQVLSPGPAMVVVLPADSVELMPDAKGIQGLIRQQIAPPMKLPERQQVPIFYRSEGKNVVFAAELRVHSRRIEVEVANLVNLEEELARVEQKFSYSIAYEALDHVLLDVPQVLAGPKHMEILRDGKPLAAKILSQQRDASLPAGMVRMHVSLSEPTIGLCELVVRYSTSLPPLTTSSPTLWSVPLVVPAETELAGNTLYLTVQEGIKIVDHGEAWKSAEKNLAGNGPQARLQLQANDLQHSFDLEAQREDRGVINATVGERAWIQTWFTSSDRQDRAAFQFSTNQKEVVFQVPNGAAVEKMLVILDGQRMAAQQLGPNRFSLPLTGGAEIRRYLLELDYHFSGQRPAEGLLSLEFPRIAPDVWIRRMYWQLVLPQHEHLIVNPRGFVGEYHWNWSGYYWGREALLDQTQLETWIGTTHRTVLPEGVNTYLFSVLGNAYGAELRTASRTIFVLTASGAALILGLLLIYVPIFRHPFSLLGLSLGLLILAMIHPEPVTLIAQASGLGLALTLMAGLLERSMARRRKKGLLKEPSKVIRDLASTRTPRPPVPAAAPGSSTKAITPVAQALPLPEEPSQ